jgi:CRISPR/Cas system CMR subunit Cmr4 (Cas7 group RAMP superfamily)
MNGISISGALYPYIRVEDCDSSEIDELSIIVDDVGALLELAEESELDLIDIFNAVVESAERERVTLPVAADIENFTDDDLLDELRRRLVHVGRMNVLADDLRVARERADNLKAELDRVRALLPSASNDS